MTSQTRKLATTLFTALALLGLVADATPVQSPMRVRLNGDLIRSIFHKKD